MKSNRRRIALTIALMMIVQSVILCNSSYVLAKPAPQEAGSLPLPDGKAGQNYEYQLRTEGGLAPLTWRLVGGELPPGVSLESSGVIKGVPTTPRREAYSFVV